MLIYAKRKRRCMSTFQLTDHILPQLMIKHFFEDEIYKFPAI